MARNNEDIMILSDDIAWTMPGHSVFGQGQDYAFQSSKIKANRNSLLELYGKIDNIELILNDIKQQIEALKDD